MKAAIRYIKPLTGWSHPHLMMCEDGEMYVVKLMDNPQGVRVLVNEWISSRLAERLDLPVPPGELIYISDEIAASEPNLPNLFGGPHYGSRFIPNRTDHPTEQQLAGCGNKEQAAEIIIFDHWLDNNDRHQWRSGEQNIIVSMEETLHLWMIDNGNICSGPNWTAESLEALIHRKRIFWGELYQRFIPLLDPDDPFGNALLKFQSFSIGDLIECVASIPAEWGVTNKEKESLVFYILGRSKILQEITAELQAYIRSGQLAEGGKHNERFL